MIHLLRGIVMSKMTDGVTVYLPSSFGSAQANLRCMPAYLRPDSRLKYSLYLNLHRARQGFVLLAKLYLRSWGDSRLTEPDASLEGADVGRG